MSNKNINALVGQNVVSEKDQIRFKAYRFNGYMERLKQSNNLNDRDLDYQYSIELISLMTEYTHTKPCLNEHLLFFEDKRYKKIQNS